MTLDRNRMRDWHKIVEAFERLCADGQPAALATVVSVEGSSYRRPGARMLVAGDGRTWGTVSGGCLEQDVARRARMLIVEPGNPFVISYETDEEGGGEETARPIVDPGPSLGCGGRIEILIQRVTRDDSGALTALAAIVRRRIRAAVATVIRQSAPHDDAATGAQLIQIGDEISHYRLPDPRWRKELKNQIRQAPPDQLYAIRRIELPDGGWLEALLEWLVPAQALAIFGGGHDVGPLVDLAKSLGWHVTVIGPRAEAGLRQRFPSADAWISSADDPGAGAADLPADSAAVVMGHDLRRDTAALAKLLKNPRAYIGVLGPRHRTARLLAASGHAGQEDRIYSPVGLDIGAETPEQIALSILSEIQAVIAERAGGFLRDRSGPIHLNRADLKNICHS